MLNVLRQTVRRSNRQLEKDRPQRIAAEVAQWLTVWLQNPQIFAEWLSFATNTPNFAALS
jgi:hypothetical protein